MNKLLPLSCFLALLCGGSCPAVAGDRPATSPELLVAGKPLHAWAADLKDPDEDVRIRALGVFQGVGGKARPALPAIRAALKDPSYNVRLRACSTLGAMGRESIPLLLDALASDDPSNYASAVLGQMGPVAAPQLLKALGHPDPRVRRGVVSALTTNWNAGSQVNAALRRALEDPDGLVRLRAAEALPHMDRDSPPPVDVIRAALHDPDPAVRLRAAEIVMNLGVPVESIGSMLEPALQDADGRVRVQAALSLWVRDHEQRKKALPVLLAALTGEDESACDAALSAEADLSYFDRNGIRAALPALRVVLQQRARHRPRTILGALGGAIQMGAEASETRPVLLELVQADDPGVASNAMEWLPRMAPLEAPFLKALVRALGHRNAWVREAAARTIAGLGRNAGPAVPALADALKDPSPEVRATVARALGQLGRDAGPTLLALAGALKDPAPRVRAAAAEACRELGPLARAVAGPLAQLLDDKDPGVRARAALALPRVDPGQGKLAIPALIRTVAEGDQMGGQAAGSLRALGEAGLAGTVEALASEDGDLRRAAAGALASLGQGKPGTVAPALQRAVKDPELGVRVTAARALTGLGYRDAHLIPILIEGLGSHDLSLRNGAVEALSVLGPAARPAVPALVPILADPDEGPIRAAVARVVGAAGGGVPAAESALIAALGADDSRIPEAAAGALAQLRTQDPKAVPPLLRLIAHPADRGVPHEAGEILQRAGTKALPALLDAARDPDPDLRRVALDHLPYTAPEGREQALQVLNGALADPDTSVRLQAASILGFLAVGPRHVPGQAVKPDFGRALRVVREVLKEKDPADRVRAVHVLGSLGGRNLGLMPEEVRALVLDAAKDRDAPVRAAALQVLADRRGPRVGPDLVPVFVPAARDRDPTVRSVALKGLAELLRGGGSEELRPVLLPVFLAALKDREIEIRIAAIEYINLFGPAAREAVPDLIALLKGPNERQRELALRTLVWVGKDDPDAAAALIRAFGDGTDDWSRIQAANLLGSLGPAQARPALPALEAALRDKNPAVREAAVRALAQIDTANRHLLPALVELLAEEKREPHVRDDARRQDTWFVNTIGQPAIDGLLTLLRDKDPGRRAGAALALGYLGQAAARSTPELKEALQDGQPRVRLYAAEALWRVGGDATPLLPVLTTALKEKDSRLRRGAVQVLGQMAQGIRQPDRDNRPRRPGPEPAGETAPAVKEAVPALVAALDDPDEEIRNLAVMVLANPGPGASAAVPALVDHLKEGNDLRQRRAAAWALGRVGPAAKTAVPALRDLLTEGGDRELRTAAVQALGVLGPDARDAIPQMVRLLPEVDLRERQTIVWALSSIGTADTVGPALAEAARSLSDSGDADRMLTQALTDAFRKLGPGVSGEVAKLLKDRRTAVRRLAVMVLLGFGRNAKPVLPELLAELDDKDDEAAVEAALAVSVIEPRAECVPPLVRALKAPDSRLRERAISVLQRLGPVARDAVPALEAALQDPDPTVRQWAGSALRAIGPAAPKPAGKP
jgi:HEAT repeat protein